MVSPVGGRDGEAAVDGRSRSRTGTPPNRLGRARRRLRRTLALMGAGVVGLALAGCHGPAISHVWTGTLHCTDAIVNLNGAVLSAMTTTSTPSSSSLCRSG